MKKQWKTLLATAILGVGLCIGASASEKTHVAEQLQEIGMFQGSGGDFALERVPTRTEAAVMLVRLMGAEETAKHQYTAGSIQHPFTDVDAWANPYLAWLYTNGLTNGLDGKRFGGSQSCNAQMYLTFLLRTLGYSEKSADFTYQTALDFAKELGLYAEQWVDSSFQRADLANLTLQALATPIKDTEESLLSQLVASGAVDEQSAKALQEKIALYWQYREDKSLLAEETDWDMTLALRLYTDEGVSKTEMRIQTQQQQNGSLSSATSLTLVGTDGETQKIQSWTKDGMYYQQNGTERTKRATTEAVTAVNSQIEPLYLFHNLSVTASKKGVTYTAELSQEDSGWTSLVAPILGGELPATLTKTIQFDSKGQLVSETLDFVEQQEGKQVTTLQLVSTYHASGTAVSIAWPNFSLFS